MTVAINVDGRHPAGAPTGGKLVGCSFEGARLLSHPYAWSYAENVLVPNSIQILGIVTDESDGYILPQMNIMQIGNEADLSSPALDHMSPQAYVELWRLYTETYQDMNVDFFTAGFASGDPSYWETVWNLILENDYIWPNAVAVHPYNKTPSQARNLLDEYWNVTSQIPVVVTEWFRSSGVGQIWPFQDMLNGNGGDNLGPRASIWNSWFCWSDGMVPGFGLVNAQGNPNNEGYELVSALGGSF